MRIVLYGRPSCGKGTIATELVRRLPQKGLGETTIFSMSNCLREYAAGEDVSESESRHIESAMKAGKIVASEVVEKAFKRATFGSVQNVIYDGVPRHPNQISWFMDSDKPIVVIYFDLARELALARRDIRIIEYQQSGQEIRPDDKDLLTAMARQDEFESHHAEMVRLFHQFAEDGFHTINACLTIDERTQSVIDFISEWGQSRKGLLSPPV